MGCLSDVKLPVYILVILFGMGSWVAVNGLWVELPILVDRAVEGWTLSSYLVIIIQVANIGPLLYTIVHKLAPNKFHEKHGVFLLVVIGSIACLLLVFLWKDTSYIGGYKHSTGLLFAVFLLSLVDCTSSVVFLPYMSIFKPQYISALYFGEGLSGLVPSLVALGQGVGKTICVNKTKIVNQTMNITKLEEEYVQPNFPVENFFYFLFSIMIICGLSFALLNYLPYCKKEHVSSDSDIASQAKFVNGHSTRNAWKYEQFDNPTEDNEQADDISDHDLGSRCEVSVDNTASCFKLTKTKFIYLLVLIAIINALTNGVLPAIQSYACIPYGSETYHLVATLSIIANPLACAAAFFLPVLSAKIISSTTSVGTALSIYILVLAAHSPNPPLVGQVSGSVLVIIVYVLLSAFMTFSKVSIATTLRLGGRKALLWCGIVTQIGSAVGAILMFLLVNVQHLFKSKSACS